MNANLPADENDPAAHEAMIEGIRQSWRDAVNRGERFHFTDDDFIEGWNFKEPYMILRLAEKDDESAVPFSLVACALYHNNVGALLCHKEWSLKSDDSANAHWVSFGDVIDFLVSGEMLYRQPASLGWGAVAEDIIYYSPADYDT